MAPHSSSRTPKAKVPSDKASRKGKNKEHHSESRKSSNIMEDPKDKRRNEIMLNYARFYNRLELELPEDEDFAKVPRKGYYLRLRQLREKLWKDDERPSPESATAPAPCVPDPYDDGVPTRPYWGEEGDEEEENHGRPRKRIRSTVSSKKPEFYRKFTPLSQEFILPEDESDEEELPDHILRKTPPTFMGVPREIRMEIYHYLLTVEKPIVVHGGWKQVYWTKDLQLSTDILRVCKAVYTEACTVLYGANTFLYRLRDPAYNVARIVDLAMDDSWPLQDEHDEADSGSEYEQEEEDEEEDEDEDEEEGSDSSEKESTIDIARYMHLFRKIAIEAEANRYSKYTQDSMAAAVDVFGKQDEANSEGAPCNIHTLTVRVTPLWDRQQDEPDQGRFTFVDFFVAGGPVIRAIKAVDCQMLHVDILTRQTSRASAYSPVTMSGSGACRLTINRRHERVHKNIQQDGLGDAAMRRRTEEMARRSSMAIDRLAWHIEEQCSQRNFHQATTMGLAADLLSWDDNDDEYSAL